MNGTTVLFIRLWKQEAKLHFDAFEDEQSVFGSVKTVGRTVLRSCLESNSKHAVKQNDRANTELDLACFIAYSTAIH